ncbi:MAG: hypothetical protein NTV48_00635, partial [Candidatus Vogelbacteria bacterium]|nr:hypothetical protein [Candidatus Vogelbacteria bacterium]
MKKYLIISLVVILVVIGAGITYSKFGKSVAVEPSPVVCTKEVKICPDGSTVGRMSPNCEFEECPFTPDIVDETANWKTYKNTLYGFVIKYPAN